MVYVINMLRKQIYLGQEHNRYLQKKAQENGSSVSKVIRSMIDKEQLKTGVIKKKRIAKFLLSLAEDAKRLRLVGPKDLAANLDKYLYGGN